MRGPNICFHWEIREIIFELPSVPLLIWSSVYNIFAGHSYSITGLSKVCQPSLLWGHQFTLAKFLHKNIFCDPSVEPSHWDGSNEGSQHIFSSRNNKIIFELFSIPTLQDTVVALQALARFASLAYSGDTNLQLEVKGPGIDHVFTVTPDNSLLYQSQPARAGQGDITFSVAGQGCAMLQVCFF